MGKTDATDSGTPFDGTPYNETAKQLDASNPLSQADTSKLLDDIGELELKIDLLHIDYEALTERLESSESPQNIEIKDLLRNPFIVEPVSEKPSSHWLRRAVQKVMSPKEILIKLARRAMKRPEQSEQLRITPEEKKFLAEKVSNIQERIEQLTYERNKKMAELDAATRSKHEAQSNVTRISDFVASRSARVLAANKKPAAARHQQPHGSELAGRTFDGKPIYENKTEADYVEFVDDLRLTTDQKEKLKKMVGGYEEAVATARDFDRNIVVPSKEQVMVNIMAMGRRKLEKIASIMGKPELIINPANISFEQMKNDMDLDVNRPYARQENGYIATDYQWSAGRPKVSVSIIDMCQNPKAVPGQQPGQQRNDEQLRACEKYFRENGMKLIHDYQYAMGMQRSLRAYATSKQKGEKNPEKHIIDFYGQPHETVTIFNQENNPDIQQVAGGVFNPRARRVRFNWINPDAQFNALRGRGAVQVM